MRESSTPCCEKEQRFLRLFENERRPFYVIGVSDDEDLKHELVHALFFTRPAYRRAVRAAMREYDTSALEKRLAAMGYHRSVLADEVNAYLVAPDGEGWSLPALAGLRKELRALFRDHSKELSFR